MTTEQLGGNHGDESNNFYKEYIHQFQLKPTCTSEEGPHTTRFNISSHGIFDVITKTSQSTWE